MAIITSSDKRKAAKLGITPEEYVLTIKAEKLAAEKEAIKQAEKAALEAKLAAEAEAERAEAERVEAERIAADKEEAMRLIKIKVLSAREEVEHSVYFTREDTKLEKEHNSKHFYKVFTIELTSYLGVITKEFRRMDNHDDLFSRPWTNPFAWVVADMLKEQGAPDYYIHYTMPCFAPRYVKLWVYNETNEEYKERYMRLGVFKLEEGFEWEVVIDSQLDVPHYTWDIKKGEWIHTHNYKVPIRSEEFKNLCIKQSDFYFEWQNLYKRPKGLKYLAVKPN
jgi:hypothetical protein